MMKSLNRFMKYFLCCSGDSHQGDESKMIRMYPTDGRRAHGEKNGEETVCQPSGGWPSDGYTGLDGLKRSRDSDETRKKLADRSKEDQRHDAHAVEAGKVTKTSKQEVKKVGSVTSADVKTSKTNRGKDKEEREEHEDNGKDDDEWD